MGVFKIQVKIKNVYGNTAIYPECETAKRFAALAKQKTLTTREINIIKDLGYTVEVIQDKVTL